MGNKEVENKEKEINEFDQFVEPLLEQLDTIQQKLYTPAERMTQEEEVHSRQEYEAVLKKYEKYHKYEEIINDCALDTSEKSFFCHAYCSHCGKDVTMYYRGAKDNSMEQMRDVFRDNFYCPICQLTGRWRRILSKVRQVYSLGKKVYMYEYNSPAYFGALSFVSKGDLIGSEYFGSEYKSGEYVNGVLHEDATNLSFSDESLDIILSLDVFEHIYFYKKAFQEIYRVLKPGGKLFLTIPMEVERDITEDRAKIENGKTIFLKEPVYHGGANHTDFGVLAYTDFGWDILEIIKSVGFSDVKFITYYSIREAYFGRVWYYLDITK